MEKIVIINIFLNGGFWKSIEKKFIWLVIFLIIIIIIILIFIIKKKI